MYNVNKLKFIYKYFLMKVLFKSLLCFYLKIFFFIKFFLVLKLGYSRKCCFVLNSIVIYSMLNIIVINSMLFVSYDVSGWMIGC